jgi:PAS domain S-box-containing protein
MPLPQPSWIVEAPVPLAARWSCDLAGDVLCWTPGVFDLFGIAPGTRLDRREVVEFYTPESRALMERLRAQAIAERGSFTMEAELRRADGTTRRMLLSADTLVRGGRVTHLHGIKQDITGEMAGGGRG